MSDIGIFVIKPRQTNFYSDDFILVQSRGPRIVYSMVIVGCCRSLLLTTAVESTSRCVPQIQL